MRPLIVQVPRGEGQKILNKAKQLEGKNLSLVQASDGEKEVDLVYATFSNGKVEGIIAQVDKIEDAHITLFPQGVMAMYPPDDQAPEQVTDVELRSPIEIFLSGLQSIGSWKGFIGYSVITSIVVWIGLFTNTSYLLVAAMLIAPFAGPAMNTAIATARGDWPLLRKSMTRYFISIIITITGAWILSVILQQNIATSLMVSQNQISSVAVLLALSAGAAGAMNLVQSNRDSLVSGAAIGMLVAASLAPPAGVVGMAAALGEWEMIKRGLFLLFLQLVSINIAGSLVFRLFGLNQKGPRYNRGKNIIYIGSLSTSLVLLGVLLYFQFHQAPELQRSSLERRAAAEIQTIVKNEKHAKLVEAEVRFARGNIEEQPSLLCIIYVQRDPADQDTGAETIRRDLTHSIQNKLISRGFDVTPLVSVVVLDSP
jgi:uncharacterized hydrophobic protein (TIGR00271 family)